MLFIAALLPVGWVLHANRGEPLLASKTVMEPTTVYYGVLPELFDLLGVYFIVFLVFVIIPYGLAGGFPRGM